MSDRPRRKWLAPVIVLVVILALAGYVTATQLGTAPAATSSVTAPGIPKPAAFAYAAPSKGESQLDVAGSAYPGANGTLGTSGGTAAVPIASISKLITALVILDKRPLSGTSDNGPTLTFSKADSDLYDKYYVMGASIQPMKTGSRMSLHDALTTMLVASACNYADAVSTWAFGSQANFLAATRKWLAAHGLSGTKMVEPTGVSAQNVSTPTDMIAIGRLAMANPLVASIVGSSVASVANIGTVVNTNDLLGVKGINGIKTGTLVGSNLLYSATLPVAGITDPLTVVGVVLGGDDRSSVDGATQALISSIESGFQKLELTKQDVVFATVSTPWKDTAKIVAGENAFVLTWSNNPIKATVSIDPITTAKSGTKVGTVTYQAGNEKVVVPLVLKGSITEPDAWWKLSHGPGTAK